MSFYDKYYQEYSDATISLELSHIYDPFLKLLPAQSRILDVGCGPGRDIKFFQSLGHDVTGLDPSKEMVKLAKENTHTEIIHGSIQEINFNTNFDGLWACASLLHVQSNELNSVFDKISQILNPCGVFYCSFKNGDFEGVADDGRYFTYLTEGKLRNHLNSIPVFEIKKIWISNDVRSDKDISWINCLVIKRN